MNTIAADSSPEGRQKLLEKIEDAVIDAAGAGEPLSELLVALDEILTNIANHGYGAETKGPIRVGLELSPEESVIVIHDEAPPFDPTGELSEPEVAPTLASVKAGGLGIRLVIELIDNVEYEYANGNQLTLRHGLLASDDRE